MRWVGHVVGMGGIRNEHNILVRKQRKRPLGRSRGRRENNIGMDLRETGSEGVDWMHVAQDRIQWWAPVNTVMNLRVL
jgi:hypothetical protein